MTEYAILLCYAACKASRHFALVSIVATVGVRVMQSPRSGHVFLSYAAVDRERALAVADELEAAGIAVWIDRRGITGGELWAAEISSAIRTCKTLALLCTPSSIASKNVRQELQLAWDYDRPILPLILEPVEFPDTIAYFVHGRQWIKILDVSTHFWIRQVAAALRDSEQTPELLDVDHAVHLSNPPSNAQGGLSRLPEPPTPLVGRTSEIADVVGLFRDGQRRLVTLTGPGGVGKTRLAVAIAHQMSGDGQREVVFAELAPLSDVSLVSSALAAAAGLSDSDNRPPELRLIEKLQRSTSLVVVDNMEHLLGASPFIADLLRACPTLIVLVTSRELLQLRGEHEYPVPPLSLPAPTTPIEELPQNEAMELFMSRAADARSAVPWTVDQLKAAAEICRRLDGLPLAIELAAARLRLLSPAALLERLEGSLGILTGGSRDAPSRQKTLRDTIAWSYDLLTPEEQSFLDALSIFAGGFTFEAAEAVAGGPGLNSFDLLSSLLDKSLLQRLPAVESRFRMLETIREFGLDRLRATGREESTRQRHFEYFVDFTRNLSNGLDQGDPNWYTRAIADWKRELDNLRSAWAWRLAMGDHAGVLRLMCIDARYHWGLPGQEVLDVLERCLQVGTDIPLDVRGGAELALASSAVWIGDLERGLEHVGTALFTAEQIGDMAGVAFAHASEGALWELAGDCERSKAAHRAAVEIARDIPGSLLLGIALTELGDRTILCGDDIDGGIAMLDEAIELNRSTGYAFALAPALAKRAYAALRQGNREMARTLFQESIVVALEYSDDRRTFGGIVGLAAVALDDGDPRRAAQLIGVAQAALEKSLVTRLIAYPFHRDRVYEEVQAQLGAEQYRNLVDQGRTIPYDQVLAELLENTERQPSPT